MLMNLDYPEYIKVADLGCSSGRNTLFAMSEIVNTIIQSYHQKGRPNAPEIECCLNDLPHNDFNTTFKLVPSFLEKLKMEVKGKCFVSGVPNSFYSRLFPSMSLHLAHSSFSLHWLSRVPDGLENNNTSIHINDTSPPDVYKSYLNQFKNDFSLFLRMRSEEIVPNGQMVLTFVGRKVSDPLSKNCFQVWSLLSDCILDLVSEVPNFTNLLSFYIFLTKNISSRPLNPQILRFLALQQTFKPSNFEGLNSETSNLRFYYSGSENTIYF